MTEKTYPTTTVEQKRAVPREETRQEDRYLSPPVDIYETTEELVVVADLPGVEKTAIDVRVDNNIFTIQGKTNYAATGNPLSAEFILMDYYRQFQLGEQINQQNISADLKNGVLIIHLPKVEKMKPKKISVNVASMV